MIGVKMNYSTQVIVDEMIERGFLINSTRGNVLRLVPPLLITKNQIYELINNFDEIFLKHS